jgi:methionyl-tRNA formyltransferase
LQRIILITQREFTDLVTKPLQTAAPGVRIEFAWTLGQLTESVRRDPVGARLISLGSDIIVPADTLDLLPGPAYNFHPGPPEYPGIFPSVFALYEDAKKFGVTLHEMAPQIDSGPIVAVDEFGIQPEWDRLALDTTTFATLQNMLEKFAPQLVDVDSPLPTTSIPWGKPRRTCKEFEDLCVLPADVGEAEFVRRYRAVGEGPEHALTIERFGRKFYLASAHTESVVRGGQPVTQPDTSEQ